MDNYIEFLTEESLRDWLSHNYSDELLKRLKEEVMSISSPLFDYVGGAYRVINQSLRMNDEEIQTDYDIIGLQKFLCSLTIPENLLTTRFVSVKEYRTLIWNTRLNREYVYPCFLSTTLIKDLYHMQEIRHHRIPIKILVPKGTNGSYIPEVNPKNPEFELLMPYRVKLKRKNLTTFIIV